MYQITDLQVIVIPANQGEINQDATADEVTQYMIDNDDFTVYDLGRYFEDHNEENLGQHFAFLRHKDNGRLLNGLYNVQCT